MNVEFFKYYLPEVFDSEVPRLQRQHECFVVPENLTELQQTQFIWHVEQQMVQMFLDHRLGAQPTKQQMVQRFYQWMPLLDISGERAEEAAKSMWELLYSEECKSRTRISDSRRFFQNELRQYPGLTNTKYETVYWHRTNNDYDDMLLTIEATDLRLTLGNPNTETKDNLLFFIPASPIRDAEDARFYLFAGSEGTIRRYPLPSGKSMYKLTVEGETMSYAELGGIYLPDVRKKLPIFGTTWIRGVGTGEPVKTTPVWNGSLSLNPI